MYSKKASTNGELIKLNKTYSFSCAMLAAFKIWPGAGAWWPWCPCCWTGAWCICCCMLGLCICCWGGGCWCTGAWCICCCCCCWCIGTCWCCGGICCCWWTCWCCGTCWYNNQLFVFYIPFLYKIDNVLDTVGVEHPAPLFAPSIFQIFARELISLNCASFCIYLYTFYLKSFHIIKHICRKIIQPLKTKIKITDAFKNSKQAQLYCIIKEQTFFIS